MELFTEMARFRAWLRALPDDGTAGFRWDEQMCPLARWLSEELCGMTVSIDINRVRLGPNIYGHTEPLPPFLCYFVAALDDGASIESKQARVSPAEALAVLDTAEKQAAQLLLPKQACSTCCVYRDAAGICGQQPISPVLHAFVTGDAPAYDCYEIHGRLCAQHTHTIVVPLPGWLGRGHIRLPMSLEEVQMRARKTFFQDRQEELADLLERRARNLEEVV